MGEVASGLEGVVVARTTVSEVDGQGGTLRVGGYPIAELTRWAGFEEVCALLLDGQPPTAQRTAEWQRALGQARVRAFERLGTLGDALERDSAMDALRASVAHGDPSDRGDEDPTGILGAVAVYAAAWARRQAGGEPTPADPTRRHAADLLAMIHGAPQPDAACAALDAYLTTVSEHGMNASTFAARVVASTGSDRVSATVAALGALKGRLHGGAPGPVLDMLDAIEHAEGARPWLTRELDAGRRIMGMGHRVYRTRDPRATALEGKVRELSRQEIGSPERLALAQDVEREAEGLLAQRHPDRPLRANVEFYTAVLLEALGIPRALFTAVFAAGRSAGWAAHIGEQQRTGRLIRPSSVYVGRRMDTQGDDGPR
jgi:citrate synthase